MGAVWAWDDSDARPRMLVMEEHAQKSILFRWRVRSQGLRGKSRSLKQSCDRFRLRRAVSWQVKGRPRRVIYQVSNSFRPSASDSISTILESPHVDSQSVEPSHLSRLLQPSETPARIDSMTARKISTVTCSFR